MKLLFCLALTAALLGWIYYCYPKDEYRLTNASRAELQAKINNLVPLSTADIGLDAELVMEEYDGRK